MSAIDDVIRAAAIAAENIATMGAPPRRGLAILMCMDARIDPVRVLGIQPGDAHILRNPGGVVGDAELRALAISQRLMGTQEVMVVHHTDCGAAQLDEDALNAEIERDTGSPPPWLSTPYQTVEESVSRVRACDALPHRDAVRGFVFHVENGRLVEVD
ncbi:MAG: carbonic anhydrase [Solirubrobacteraceae bacterium]|nr:carbonic anhydrase [Solirubrobacteraceae bacterium]